MIYNDIHYTKVGHGPHLCFLHGFCESQLIWEELISSLSSAYTCLSIDLPGFGKSSSIDIKSIPETAKSIHALLKYENATDAILFGHSLGGYIVSEYVHQFGKEVSAAALVHSTARPDSDEKKINRQKTINFIDKHGLTEFFKIFTPNLVAATNISLLKPDLLEDIKRTKIESIQSTLLAMKNRESRVSSLSKFDKPILLLHGELDSHYNLKDIYKEASNYSNVQLNVLPNVGHLSMYEDPETCLKTVLDFLKYIALQK